MKLSGKPKTMDIHEYEAKAILKDYGVPVPAGAVARSAEAAEAVAAGLGGASYAVKAQVLAVCRKPILASGTICKVLGWALRRYEA